MFMLFLCVFIAFCSCKKRSQRSQTKQIDALETENKDLQQRIINQLELLVQAGLNSHGINDYEGYGVNSVNFNSERYEEAFKCNALAFFSHIKNEFLGYGNNPKGQESFKDRFDAMIFYWTDQQSRKHSAAFNIAWQYQMEQKQNLLHFQLTKIWLDEKGEETEFEFSNPFVSNLPFTLTEVEDSYAITCLPEATTPPTSHPICNKGDHSSNDIWDTVKVVQIFQSESPAGPLQELNSKDKDQLAKGVKWSYPQTIKEFRTNDAPPLEATVELTSKVIHVPYEKFVQIIPPAKWGKKLAHWLGGGRNVVYEKDNQGRPIRQVERMVLSSLPGDINIELLNNDMAKVEVIEYDERRAKVYWRVFYSDNGSTETDIGSVEFKAYDSISTQVTFHSAHRVNLASKIPLNPSILGGLLTSAFMDHLLHYEKLVTSANK